MDGSKKKHWQEISKLIKKEGEYNVEFEDIVNAKLACADTENT